MLASAVGRVRTAALLSAAVWGLILLGNGLLAPHWQELRDAGWPRPNWVYAAAGVLGSLALAWGVERFKEQPRFVLDLGLGLEVLTAALIGLVDSYHFVPDEVRISWVVVVILLWPAITPTAPRRLLVAGLLAASMDGVGLAVAGLSGHLDHLSLSGTKLAATLAWMLAPNYLCAFLALVPATLIRRLGREAGAARELGSYRLGRLLDRGGMGEVYEATHRMIAKPAAIKLIRPELLTDSPTFADVAVARFYREAEAVAALRSPHTVSLYDFGVADDGTLYYVMELLDGINLQRLVERFGPLPPERVIHILCQICDSLGEAHERGMVHRDIKPSNILLCRLGKTVDFVKVLDFGLVRHEIQPQETGGGLTAPTGPPGTPSYMAPEMLNGSEPVDRRADLYALGCVGYWLLTGHTVFGGTTPIQIMYQHCYDPPLAPSLRLEAPVPVELEAVVLAALAKQPGERPQTAESFADRISACDVGNDWGMARAQAWWTENLTAAQA